MTLTQAQYQGQGYDQGGKGRDVKAGAEESAAVEASGRVTIAAQLWRRLAGSRLVDWRLEDCG